MKISIAQINTIPADLKGNSLRIIEALAVAASHRSTAVFFPFGSLSGVPLMDIAHDPNFLASHSKAIEKLAAESKNFPELQIFMREIAGSGGMYGQLMMIQDGIITECESAIVNLQFENNKSQPIEFHSMSEMFSHDNPNNMLELLNQRQAQLGIPVVYANQVGGSTDIIWSGGSAFINTDGKTYKMPLFEESIQTFDLHNTQLNHTSEWGNKIENIYSALILGIRDYFAKNKFHHACIALSGGIDSAVVVALAVDALGSDRVQVIMLPSEYSSDHSVYDSVDMINRCGIKGDKIFISDIFNKAIEALSPVLNGEPSGLAHENMQSRIRLMLTMAISNQTGALMLNTSNKSEVAVGYGTLYGDTSGALGVIADLYKGEVYELARYINERSGNIIPENIINKAPSAELRPDQKDSDSLPEYPVLDKILHMMIEQRLPLQTIIDSPEFESEHKNDILRTAKLLWNGDFKRHQLPPAIRLSGATLGYERKRPITKSSDFTFDC